MCTELKMWNGANEFLEDADRYFNEYLKVSKQFKYRGDEEKDLIKRSILYLKSVFYFLLVGNITEKTTNSEIAVIVYKDAIPLIKYISASIRPQQNVSATHTILAVLSFRCQSLLYLKSIDVKNSEISDNQKIINDYFEQSDRIISSAYARKDPRIQGNDTVSTLMPPVSPSMFLPHRVYNAWSKQNQYFCWFACYQDLWNDADYLLENADHSSIVKDFFVKLDKQYKPMSLTNSVEDIVTYLHAALRELSQ